MIFKGVLEALLPIMMDMSSMDGEWVIWIGQW